MDRRTLLKTGAASVAMLALGPDFWRSAYARQATAGPGPYGPLLAPDVNGLMLPEGFSSRVIARSAQPVSGSAYLWHFFPDGGATFATEDGGWIYTSNSEVPAAAGGGASAIRFGGDGAITGAYRILTGTSQNCAGGPTPWGTWLSCEEHPLGQVWECDPTGVGTGVARPALGTFSHEAVAVDRYQHQLYLTEDQGDGRFYRFTPARYPDLDEGVLEAAAVADDNSVTWLPVDNPDQPQSENRNPSTTAFDGGEGCWFDSGYVYFTTKGDNRVWSYDTVRERIEIIYDDDMFPEGEAPLTGVDNVIVAPSGDLLVAEDGGNMEIVLITPERVVAPLLRIEGQDGSELCGPAFDPSGTRLYFSSQRGGDGGLPGGIPTQDPGATGSGPGITYEVTGPFRPEARRAVGRGRQRRARQSREATS